MATPSTHFLHLKLVLFAAFFGILIVSGSAQEECGVVEGLAVLNQCQEFIQKEGPQVKPSSDCCDSVQTIGMTCVCKVINQEVENTLSMEKLVFVAQSCGAPLQPGTMCGSYKVPPA